tara:strand:+ start:12799 stop:14457 length:1659 start_codon:yes stop_codon:yes gene_type:complete
MSNFKWLTKEARSFLKVDGSYLKEEDEYEGRTKEICDKLEEISGIKGFSDKFYDYCEKGWVSFASPVLANFGRDDRGLPASCNFGKVSDTVLGIFEGLTEMAVLAKHSAGTAYDFSSIRPNGSPISTGGLSDGVMPWISLYSEGILKVTQSNLRRGFFVSYLRADHPDIFNFMSIGQPDSPIQNSYTGVIFPEGFIEKAKSGESQHNRNVISKFLEIRTKRGFPYAYFEDNANEQKPQVYKEKGMKISSSNICSEIVEYCDEEKTFVCVLSSANLNHYDAWKDTDFIFDFRIALDCFVEEYIIRGGDIQGIERSVRFAKEHRAVGLGVLGFHDLLQSKSIAFDSFEAQIINAEIFKYMEQETLKASKWMAQEWGEPSIMEGTGLRSSTNMAVAPTKSSSRIMGQTSQGIQPIVSNSCESTTANDSPYYRNKNLSELLESKGKNTEDIWDMIDDANGSVSGLDFLTEHEKDVFKMAREVNQVALLKLAAGRQKYIDQGQSLNTFFHPETPAKEVAKLFFMAHELGLKTLYYQYTGSAAEEFNRNQIECNSCEG